MLPLLLLLLLAGTTVFSDRPQQPVPPPAEGSRREAVHRTDFLTLHVDGKRTFTGEYPAYPANLRAGIRRALLERRYTHLWLNALHEDKQAHTSAPAYDYIAEPRGLLPYLEEIVADGLRPVVMLGFEDAPGADERYPVDTLLTRLEPFVRTVDGLTDTYLLGVEVSEYWTDPELDRIGTTLRRLSRKTILLHFNQGQYEEALVMPWADGIAYQYGFGLRPEDIESRTRELAPLFHQKGKLFIAAEYALNVSEQEAIELGAAAMRGGADGFANGGR